MMNRLYLNRPIVCFYIIAFLGTSGSFANTVREYALGYKNFSEVLRIIHDRYENEADDAELFKEAWKALYVQSATAFEKLIPASDQVMAATHSPRSASETISKLYATKIERSISLIAKAQAEDATPSVRDMWNWATSGLVGALQDPYSQFLPPREHKQLQQVLSGKPDETSQFYGVGISVDWDTDGNAGVLVIAPLPGTPAEQNGVQAGDVIIGVNGEMLKNWEGTYSEKLEKAINMIKGEKGTKVTLTLKKAHSPEPVDITLERAPINADLQISQEMLDEEIGRITLAGFYENADEDILKALRTLRMQGMKKVILDLRFNPGGYLDQAVHISDIFLPKGSLITYTEGRESPKREFVDETTSSEGYSDIPVVILVNQYSASASEVVTGALKDNQRAFVIGKTSFGKGSVQEVFNLIDGAGLRLTVAKYYTPSGVCIHGEGIKPDFEVDPLTQEEFEKIRTKNYEHTSRLDRLMERDPQLRAACKFLRGESVFVAKSNDHSPAGMILGSTEQTEIQSSSKN